MHASKRISLEQLQRRDFAPASPIAFGSHGLTFLKQIAIRRR
jgi:hypothetical protein